MGLTINALVLRDGAIVQVGPNYAKAVAERLKTVRLSQAEATRRQ